VNIGSNDSAPPSEAANPETVSSVIPLKELGKQSKQWSLRLFPSHLEVEEIPGTPPYVILREAVMKTATLMERMQVLVLTRPIKVTFKLMPGDTARLAEWIGQPALVQYYLKHRYGWVLPIAILWMISSLPINSGAAAVPFDLVGFVMGTVLLVSWAMAKWRPHPVLFLVDSLWFVLLAGRLLKDVFVDGRSRGWLILAIVLLWMVVTGLKHFWRFRGTIIPRQ
jgi:hypothetical protein